MKTSKSLLLIFLTVFLVSACNEEFSNTELIPMGDTQVMVTPAKAQKVNKATGSVEIIWKGGEKGSDMGNKPENLRAFFDFNAHEGNTKFASKGEIVYTVTDEFLNPHRTITATVDDVRIIDDELKGKMGWFIATVNYDSKGCSGGSGAGGHDSGCSGEDDGGCADTEHDGGCTHETGDTGGSEHPDEGGCANETGNTGETEHTDGSGCTDEHPDGESCSGSDSGNPGTQGSTDKGNPLSGKNCRLGQKIVVKVIDNRLAQGMPTPNSVVDHLTWKWFGQNHTIDINSEPKKLCGKEIISGNIVVQINP